MSSQWIRIALLFASATALTGCPPGSGPSRPVQYLQFDYVVLPSSPAAIESIHDQIRDHGLGFDDAMLSEPSDTTCEYMATMSPTADQQDSELPLDQRSKAPDLNAYGDAGSASFNFILDAFQARTMRPQCGTLAETVQGLSMTSLQGPVDGLWRDGSEVSVVFRPDLASEGLGSALLFENHFDGDVLLLEIAVDSVSASGYVQGRFRFLAAPEDGQRLLIANNGQFGLMR